jgi:hypothetical protein
MRDRDLVSRKAREAPRTTAPKDQRRKTAVMAEVGDDKMTSDQTRPFRVCDDPSFSMTCPSSERKSTVLRSNLYKREVLLDSL